MSALLVISTIISAHASLQDLANQHAPSDTRIEIVSVTAPKECQGEPDLITRIDASGRVPVRFSGRNCQAWGWLQLKVWERAAITTSAFKAGEVPTVVTQEVERRLGHTVLAQLPPGARLVRPVPKGTTLTPELVRAGPDLGTPMLVKLTVGALTIEQQGTIIPCRGGAGVCAALPTGKRVQGSIEGGVLCVVASGGVP